MKRIYSILVATLLGTAATFAQSEFVATLTHGGNISTYYGSTALAEAYEASVAGDVITLSYGTFQATDITKAVTVRGKGFGDTIVTGDFSITASSDATTTLEGCRFTGTMNIYGRDINDGLDEVMLLKNWIGYIRFCGSSTKMLHCVARLSEPGAVFVDDNWVRRAFSVVCQNSVVSIPYSQDYGFFDIRNCILDAVGGVYSGKFKNSIMYGIAQRDCQVEYCLMHETGGFPAENHNYSSGDYSYWWIADVFADHKDSFDWTNNFELTDECKALKGSDGTELGVHGGATPFSITPTNPKVNRFDVQATNDNGKLSVKINVE